MFSESYPKKPKDGSVILRLDEDDPIAPLNPNTYGCEVCNES